MQEQFELDRFEWQAPDRLEVAGTFHGRPTAEAPVLIVSGGGIEHRLNAVDAAPPGDGETWRAQFVWDEAPVGVEAAVLALGSDIVIDLPPPGAAKTLLQPRSADDDDRTAPDDIALQTDLLATEQDFQELRSALQRTEAELDRARSDLETERSGRAADAERFREGLARVRSSAEQALAAARAEAEREAEALREQVAAADELQQRLTALHGAGAEAGEVRADAQRLLERMTKLADVLDAGK